MKTLDQKIAEKLAIRYDDDNRYATAILIVHVTSTFEVDVRPSLNSEEFKGLSKEEGSKLLQNYLNIRINKHFEPYRMVDYEEALDTLFQERIEMHRHTECEAIKVILTRSQFERQIVSVLRLV